MEETPEPPAKSSKEARESAYEKLALNKLTIERPAPQEPAPAPEPDRKPQKEPERRVRAGASSIEVLPGPSRKTPEPKAPTRKAPERKDPNARPSVEKVEERKPRDTRLLISIPRLGIRDVTVGDSPEQSYLDREGIMHLSETGFPYERGSNTYIVGHAADYDASRVPNVFRNLKDLKQGDLITLRDALGRSYAYRAYQYLIVNPTDVWVTEPVAGKEIVSLQTCYPAPSFEKRLIIRAERVK